MRRWRPCRAARSGPPGIAPGCRSAEPRRPGCRRPTSRPPPRPRPAGAPAAVRRTPAPGCAGAACRCATGAAVARSSGSPFQSHPSPPAIRTAVRASCQVRAVNGRPGVTLGARAGARAATTREAWDRGYRRRRSTADVPGAPQRAGAPARAAARGRGGPRRHGRVGAPLLGHHRPAPAGPRRRAGTPPGRGRRRLAAHPAGRHRAQWHRRHRPRRAARPDPLLHGRPPAPPRAADQQPPRPLTAARPSRPHPRRAGPHRGGGPAARRPPGPGRLAAGPAPRSACSAAGPGCSPPSTAACARTD